MPSVVAKTATLALSNKTTDFILEIANRGITQALATNKHLKNGLHIIDGKITNVEVKKALN